MPWGWGGLCGWGVSGLGIIAPFNPLAGLVLKQKDPHAKKGQEVVGQLYQDSNYSPKLNEVRVGRCWIIEGWLALEISEMFRIA